MEKLDPSRHPAPAVGANHVEPAPRRVRGVLGGHTVFDTTTALYVWEWPFYPQYYIPEADVDPRFLVDEQRTQRLSRGTARRYGLSAGGSTRDAAVRIYQEDAGPELAGTARFEWAALDAWFEEDEEIFVHPRNPYTRVDCLPSRRPVRISLDGVLLAESAAPVMLFETGLPTRYYVERTALRLEHLEPSDTVTPCPYKGRTTAYWSVRLGGTVHPDLAWCYDFPTAACLPIAGLVAFYNEKVDIELDGELLPRPVTHLTR